MDRKRRQKFNLLNANGLILAKGLLYDEGNVQIVWRRDYADKYFNGFTGEQYQNIGMVFGLMKGVHSIAWTSYPPAKTDPKPMPFQEFLKEDL